MTAGKAPDMQETEGEVPRSRDESGEREEVGEKSGKNGAGGSGQASEADR